VRKVPGKPGGKTWTFVPKAYGNDQEPEPVTITIQTPTEGARREMYFAIDAEASRLAAGGTAPTHARAMAGLTIPVLTCVAGVANYTGAGGEAITTAADLLEHGEDLIIAETVNAIMGRGGLGEDEKKSSGSPSGSTSAVITPFDGTAGTVVRGASPASEAAA
jgi:hypothetical protein